MRNASWPRRCGFSYGRWRAGRRKSRPASSRTPEPKRARRPKASSGTSCRPPSASTRQLEQSTTTVTSSLLRAGSGLSDALTTNVERIQLEVAGTLAAFETQRRQIDASVTESRTTAEETQRRLAEQMAGHAEALSHVSAAGTAFSSSPSE